MEAQRSRSRARTGRNDGRAMLSSARSEDLEKKLYLHNSHGSESLVRTFKPRNGRGMESSLCPLRPAGRETDGPLALGG